MSQISELENRIRLLQNLINLSKEAKDMSSQIRALQATGRARINLPYNEKVSMAKELDIRKDSLYNKIGNLQGAVGINNYLGNALNEDGTPKNSPVGIGTYQTFLIRAQSELNQIKSQQKIDMEIDPIKKKTLQVSKQQNELQSNLKMIEATTRKYDGTFVPTTIELQKSTAKKIKELEKELQESIRIEIQNEIEPIDIEILPTAVEPITVKPITVTPLDIDDVTKISITSALAIGLVSYLVLTR